MPQPQPSAPAATARPKIARSRRLLVDPNSWDKSARQYVGAVSTLNESRRGNYTHMDTVIVDGYRDKVFLCLTEPKLKSGVEWPLYLADMIMAIGLFAFGFAGRDWIVMSSSLFFFGPMKWLLRQAAKYDPQWFACYWAARNEPILREPVAEVEL